MNRKIKMNLRALFNYIRFLPLVLRKTVDIKGRQFWALGSSLEIDEKAIVNIKKWCQVEKGTLLAARTGGTLTLGKNTFLNQNCIVVARDKIEISDNVTIGPNCCIYDHDHDLNSRGKYTMAPVIIKENSWLGAGCIILKGVTIGANCVIAAGAIITHDVPDNKVIYQKRESKYVEKYMNKLELS
ncbi:acyltransferase [Clostridium perfringens]|uniref:acyltransferase n=1 Tax=Clostridium perfringens TaxID=1502 RepID=UPI001C84CF6F|nr:acyltransferase [Clostridium perfringens]MDK0534862.1 acyltransferase [Clostridium perfringens]MDM0943883.1 acyltransferase [Clostridium perfringens]MDU3867629.1 acyltransferase [Clostridium perfringens]